MLSITMNTPEHEEMAKFTVAVIATMSAGKSTLLNALLGIPLLPSKNEACTAILTRIEDIDGITEIRGRVTTINGEISEWHIIDKENRTLLQQWNCADNQLIEIQGDFPHIDNHSKRIEFIDTPGPNNSTDKNHAEITHDIIKQCQHSYVVFVMNATQFGVDDERALLQKMFGELIKKNQQTQIVFAINKMDQLDFEKGETPTKLVNSVREYLSALGFKSPIIIPVISQIALDVRQCLEAHRKGLDLPFGQRAQKRINSEVKFLLNHFDVYLEALLNNGTHDQFLERAFAQDRKTNEIDLVTIYDNIFTVKQLIEVDILSGIPFLEEMLELEIINGDFHSQSVENTPCPLSV